MGGRPAGRQAGKAGMSHRDGVFGQGERERDNKGSMQADEEKLADVERKAKEQQPSSNAARNPE